MIHCPPFAIDYFIYSQRATRNDVRDDSASVTRPPWRLMNASASSRSRVGSVPVSTNTSPASASSGPRGSASGATPGAAAPASAGPCVGSPICGVWLACARASQCEGGGKVCGVGSAWAAHGKVKLRLGLQRRARVVGPAARVQGA